MKILIFRVGAILLITGVCCVSIIASSQEQKLKHSEKKEIRKTKRLNDFEEVGTLIKSRNFMFYTGRVQPSTGMKIDNYLNINGLKIFFSLEDPENTSGRNTGFWDNSSPQIGITGMAFEGDIVQWELAEDTENLRYSLKLTLTTTGRNAGIHYEINMIINADKSASLEINSERNHIIYSNYTGHIKTM